MHIYIYHKYSILFEIEIFFKIEYIILSRTSWEEYYHGKNHTWNMLRSLKCLKS